MRRRIAIPASIAGWLLICSVAAFAQEPVGTAQEHSVPEVISTFDVPSRADMDERIAQDIVQRAGETDRTVASQSDLNTLSASVKAQSQRFKQDELDLLPVARLKSLQRHWRFFEREFVAWRAALKRASTQYLADAAELSSRSADWKATRQAAESSDVSGLLIERITSVQAQITQAQQALAPPLANYVRLSERASALETRIQIGKRSVTTAIEHNDSRLASVDAPPLWDHKFTLTREAAVESLKAGLSVETQFLADYDAANLWGKRSYYLVALAFLPLLIWLGWRNRNRVTNDAEIQVSLQVLRRPFSSWLLLAATGVLVVAPEAPVVMHQAVLFVVLIPVLRLLPTRVYQIFGSWPYVASGLYLLNLFGFVFLPNSFLHRCYLLGVTALSLILLLWLLLRPRRMTVESIAADSPTLAARIVRLVGWLAILLMVVSAIANVYGNVSLAEMLTDALLFSSYVGLALYAGANVVTSLLHIVFSLPPLAQFHFIEKNGTAILRGVNRVLKTAAMIGWLIIMLDQFRLLRLFEQMIDVTWDQKITFGQLSVSLGGVLLFMLSVLLAFWVAKTVRFILRDEILPNMSLDRGVANSVSSLTYYALILIGLFVALAAAGFQVSQLTIIIGALGVGIGLGLQNVVNNFVSGLILMFERPIQPGDVIEVTGTSGTVREIGMRATTVTTFDGADVVVPNGAILSEKLINWTLTDTNRRMEVNVGVAYGTEPKQVLELLLQVTTETQGVVVYPKPAVLFKGFGASSLDFVIRAWTDNFNDWVNIHSNLTLRVHETLVAAGIEIPFPQRDLHIRSIDPTVKNALTATPDLTATNSPPQTSPAREK